MIHQLGSAYENETRNEAFGYHRPRAVFIKSSAVNATDISQIKSQSGAPLTEANFHLDVNANGVINASDVALAKSRSGATGSPVRTQ